MTTEVCYKDQDAVLLRRRSYFGMFNIEKTELGNVLIGK